MIKFADFKKNSVCGKVNFVKKINLVERKFEKMS